MKNKFLYLTLVLLLSFGITVGCNKNATEPPKEETKDVPVTSDLIVIDRTVDDFQFTNVSLTTNDNSSSFKALITNTSEDKQEIKKVLIHFYNSDMEVIATMEAPILGSFESQETKTIKAYHFEKLDKAFSLNYEIVK